MKIKSKNKLDAEYIDKYSSYESMDDVYLIDKYFSDRGLNLEKYYDKSRSRAIKIFEEREEKQLRLIFCEFPLHTHRGRIAMGTRIYSPGAASYKKVFEKKLEKSKSSEFSKNFNRRMKKTINDVVAIINTPMRITIDAYIEMPTTIPHEEIILFQLKILNVADTPDWDNIGKCYPDMMQDILILNDDLIYSGTVNKFYNLFPRVVVTFSYQDKHDSKYIFNKIKNRKRVKELIAAGKMQLSFLE